MHYSYLQIKHFFSCLSRSCSLDKPTICQYTCAQGPYQLHLISSIYKILHDALPFDLDGRASYRPIPFPCWERICTSLSKSFRCMVQRETNVKIVMFWYKTPEVLNRQDSSISPWCCSTSIGPLFHIFWQCPLIQPFLAKLMFLLQNIMRISLPLDLLGLPFSIMKKKKKTR